MSGLHVLGFSQLRITARRQTKLSVKYYVFFINKGKISIITEPIEFSTLGKHYNCPRMVLRYSNFRFKVGMVFIFSTRELVDARTTAASKLNLMS